LESGHIKPELFGKLKEMLRAQGLHISHEHIMVVPVFVLLSRGKGRNGRLTR
jgi:hypothetical protein